MDPLPPRPTFTASEVPIPEPPPTTPVVQVAPEVATPTPTSPPPIAPPKSHKKLFILVTVLIIFLFASAIGAFFIASQQQNIFSAPTATPTPIFTPEPTPTPQPSIEPTPVPSQAPGSSPTAAPSTETQTKTITSLPALDGFLASNGTANNSIDIRAGRNAYAITRGFVSFDLSSIPKNATIESATLRLYQINTDGSPYTTGGSLKIDHVDYGGSLEGEDYALAPLATGIATLTTNGNVEWKEAVVTEAVRDDLANLRSRTGIRVRFTTEKTGGAAGGDYAYFESSENYSGTGNVPQLIIRYK